MKMKRLMVGLVLVAGVCSAADYPFRPAEMTNVTVTSGFWLPRFETNRLVTVWTDFRKSEETGRINNFIAAGKRERGAFKGIPFDDSDVFKIIEGAAYTLSTHPDAKLEKYLDDLIVHIERAQEPDGYLYTARTLGFYNKEDAQYPYGIMGPTRWSFCQSSHELYNIGHMYEAAVAYYQVTGKRKLLDVAIRSADLIDRVFGPKETQLKDVPGHEEIELALCKLYRVTGEERYLKLAQHFLDQRGKENAATHGAAVFTQDGTLENGGEMAAKGANLQNHLPVLQQREAVGHAVRAGYLYCGMADVAALTGNDAYVKAIDRLWENVVGKKLHLNGSIGARPKGEAFGANYELPNEGTYLETCAGIANALWNQRMFLMHGEAKYVDVLERVIYNGILSGVSLSGDEFFYPNPQASKGGYKRSKWFNCSCCPVNIVRFIPQIAQFAYATRGDAAYVNLFIATDARLNLASGDVRLDQKTDYPWAGLSRITVTPAKAGQRFALNVRIPGWCVGRPVPSDLYTQVVPGSLKDFTVKVNGVAVPLHPQKGYCVIDRAWQAGDVVEVAMNMPVRRIKAHDAVEADRGRLAVECGPIVYCAEGVDNGGRVLDKTIAANAAFTRTTVDVLGNIYPAFTVPTQGGSGTLKMIPYFAWCHRGDGELQTFFLTESRVNPDAIDLAPIPAAVEFKSNIDAPVAFDSTTKVTLECDDATAVEWLNRHFAEWYGAKAPTCKAGATGLQLRAGDEAYAVSADASGVKIASRTLAGIRWAAYSLRQCAIAKRGTFKTAGYILPTLFISDAPHLKFRGIHLCWLPEVRPAQIERAIRLAALMKFNYVVLEPWGMYKSEKHPWWSWPQANMTKKEVRRLVAIGRDLGVTLIPQIAAYGHAGASRSCTLKHSVLDLQPEYEPLYEPGGWNWCLTNPETQRVLRELIVELLEDFGHPPYIHLGCDEAQPPSCPDCRRRPYDEIVTEHISGLAAFAKEHGARAMIWHDMLLDRADPRWKGFVAFGSAQTAKLADTLPKDVIICDWQYSYGNMKEVRKDWPTMKYFRDKGFPVAGCPWMNHNAMKPMADYLAQIGGFGLLETTWHHLRGYDWVRMYRYAACAAWGTPVQGSTPQFDTTFANALRMVGHDMKVKDYLDTGHLNYQVPPSWWVDN